MSMLFTESPVSSSVTSLVLYAVGATVMLVILSCLLVHCERFVSFICNPFVYTYFTIKVKLAYTYIMLKKNLKKTYIFLNVMFNVSP